MILKSITMQGFKSFEKKTIIDLSKNITGVVGPNGSGKSNIGEAIRFVLGEQSMKSIRSKSLSDLIFRGAKDGNSLSRGQVSIELDNTGFKPQVDDENLSKLLVLDTIILTREVYSDGGSTYKINGAEVRLKDVQLILSFAGIGASNHTIISQGEADKILSSSPRERKEMIEDALGLKLHQVRLKESEKKLKKVEDNINIANVIKRELSPELNHLKVQMEKISKVEEERIKLQVAYIDYFRYEEDQIISLQHKIKNSKNIDEEIKLGENKLAETNLNIEKILNTKTDHNQDLKEAKQKSIYETESHISILNYELNQLKLSQSNQNKDIIVKRYLYEDLITKFSNILKALKDKSEINVIQLLENLLSNISLWSNVSTNQAELDKKISNLSSQIESEKVILQELRSEYEDLKMSLSYNNQAQELNELYMSKEKIQNQLRINIQIKNSQHDDMMRLQERERVFIYNLEEGTKFAGHQILNYKTHKLADNYNHNSCERLIERLKIRIEEIGIIDTSTIKNSFEELNDRYMHLEKEINDLEVSRKSVDTLINELENSIKVDFNKGLDKVNFAFDNYFGQIFAGGRSKLFVSKFENEAEDGEVLGIDLALSLPNKKVSDLNMLSGGERTLASIALLFALTSISPPPFMVLDETDAALDESNARKYGKLLRKLGEKSRLLVITHNRETMNECDVLLGITMTSGGDSRILSIKFD